MHIYISFSPWCRLFRRHRTPASIRNPPPPPPSSFLAMKLWEMLVRRSPMFIYAATWTALITVTVAVAAFSPEVAFVWAVSPSRACGGVGGAVRLPMEGPPGEVVCVPAHLFGRSRAEFVIPPLFAALVVAGSVSFTRAVGLWEAEEDETPT